MREVCRHIPSSQIQHNEQQILLVTQGSICESAAHSDESGANRTTIVLFCS